MEPARGTRQAGGKQPQARHYKIMSSLSTEVAYHPDRTEGQGTEWGSRLSSRDQEIKHTHTHSSLLANAPREFNLGEGTVGMKGGGYFRFQASSHQGMDAPFLNPVQQLVGLEQRRYWTSPALARCSPSDNNAIFKRRDHLPSN